VIAALALLGYAALLLTAGAAALARARWADRAPRLAVAAWLALTGSAVVSVVLGGAAMAGAGAVLGLSVTGGSPGARRTRWPALPWLAAGTAVCWRWPGGMTSGSAPCWSTMTRRPRGACPAPDGRWC
jgi:hypothetical protein